MSRIITVALYISYLTLKLASINHGYSEIKIHYSYAYTIYVYCVSQEVPFYHETRLANLLYRELYLNKAKFLPKTNTLLF